ncbi:MAG: hypothetical protein ACU83N_09865 [Gammaproteobacteria bacterium]
MNRINTLSSRLIPSRLAIVGTDKFTRLGLTKEEIRLFVTEADRNNWTHTMRRLIPALEDGASDEEE